MASTNIPDFGNRIPQELRRAERVPTEAENDLRQRLVRSSNASERNQNARELLSEQASGSRPTQMSLLVDHLSELGCQTEFIFAEAGITYPDCTKIVTTSSEVVDGRLGFVTIHELTHFRYFRTPGVYGLYFEGNEFSSPDHEANFHAFHELPAYLRGSAFLAQQILKGDRASMPNRDGCPNYGELLMLATLLSAKQAAIEHRNFLTRFVESSDWQLKTQANGYARLETLDGSAGIILDDANNARVQLEAAYQLVNDFLNLPFVEELPVFETQNQLSEYVLNSTPENVEGFEALAAQIIQLQRDLVALEKKANKTIAAARDAQE